ncbi:hypothetical protein [Thiothrix nivea]|uniref:DUF4407 domain-containing protein n=1 Tax=Thiothrix nivea (strain ATCC 35100 / DSM 5205 / JP2) TaxID=870187 RepID=A0A656HI68_THINJ|nr:hypothetical protein [Thiothrix nivea]EIJ35734.1 hypothetical protein Thini_3216 [Thiothrix nivea DSM 5205]
MQWAKAATFGLYAVAIFMLYVSDLWGIASFIAKNSNDFIALAVFSVIAFTLSYFLASSKEATYEDIAIHRSEGWKLTGAQVLAMCLFASSGVLFEMFSTTGNQQHIANSAAESSSMMKSIQQTDVSVLGSSGLTQNLMDAQAKLATCQKTLEKMQAKGRKYDCAESEARVQAVKESMAMSNQLAQDASEQAFNNKVESMLKVRDSFDKPMFQAMAKYTGTDNNTGMVLVIAVLITIFELQHIMALFAYSNALRRIKQSGNEKPAGNGYNPVFTPSPAPSAGTSPLQAMKQEFSNMVGSAPAVIANEYARAQQSRQQVYSKAADKLDSVQDDLNKHAAFLKLLVMEAQASVNHSMEPTQENIRNVIAHVLRRHQQTTGQNTQHVDLDKLTGLVIGKIKPAANSQSGDVKTYRAELREGEKVYSDSPLDKPRPAPHLSVADTVKQIQADVKASGATSPDAVQAAVFDAFAAMPNPAPLNDVALNKIADKLVINAAHTHSPTVPRNGQETVLDTVPARSETVAATVPARSQNGSSETVQNGLEGEAKQVESDLYPEWVGRVSAGKISPGARDAKRFISQRTKSKEDKVGLTVQEMGRIWTLWNERAVKEGVLKHNPDWSNGKPKYILA